MVSMLVMRKLETLSSTKQEKIDDVPGYESNDPKGSSTVAHELSSLL